jgi:hypothetical protein
MLFSKCEPRIYDAEGTSAETRMLRKLYMHDPSNDLRQEIHTKVSKVKIAWSDYFGHPTRMHEGLEMRNRY